MRLGVACTKEGVPSGFDVAEIQFEKTVQFKSSEAKKLRGEFTGIFNVHSPYYGTLASDKNQKTRDAKKRILETIEASRLLGGELIVVHAGFYAKQDPAKVFGIVRRNLEEVSHDLGMMQIGVETAPRQSQFGSVEEVMRLSDAVRGVVPVFNVDAIQERTGKYKTKKELQDLFSTQKEAYAHFVKPSEALFEAAENATLVYEGKEFVKLLRVFKH